MLQSSDTDAARLLIDGAVTLGGGGRLVLGGPADVVVFPPDQDPDMLRARSEEHTSELQSLMRISYAVFCLKNKSTKITLSTPDRHHFTQKNIPTTHIHTI